MLISGCTIFIVGILISQKIPRELNAMLTRLVNRGSLIVEPDRLETFRLNLEHRAQIWEHWTGLVCAIAILVAFIMSTGLSRIRLMLSEAVGAYLAGCYLGRMMSYGLLSHTLQEPGLSLNVQPGHLDGASGLKPLGDFYFLQAMVAAFPAIHLALWWIIIPIVPKYLWWRESYFYLLIGAIGFEILSFVIPLWLFHVEMEEQKVQLLKEADTLSSSMFDIEAQIAVSQVEQERERLKGQLSYFTKRYWDIEKMNTWPIDVKILRLFSFSNLVLSIPLISKVVGNPDVWKNMEQIINVIK